MDEERATGRRFRSERSNPYCDALGIGIPKLEVAKDHPEANYYRLLIVFLLERGEAVTLQEAAERFEEAGVAPAAHALASLKRCKPARAPIYRDGDYYALDPHDAEADRWVWRLDLRPSEAATLPVDRRASEPLPTRTEELGRMRRVLGRSTFRLDELPSGGMTVYLILPREHLSTFAPWLRLMITCCYHACTRSAIQRQAPPRRTLFLLDEFANLGYMSTMREAISLGGGYGLSLWLILQDLAQLRREYRHEWESFMANSDVIQAFAIQDPFTSEKLARMLGETSIWRRRLLRTPRRDGSRLKADYDEDGRPLLRPEEFRRLHPARQVLLVRPYQPVVADKLIYYRDPLFAGRFDANPYAG